MSVGKAASKHTKRDIITTTALCMPQPFLAKLLGPH
jgi:hypothetical protein